MNYGYRYYNNKTIFHETMSIERDMQLIYEVGCLRHINRTWEQMNGPGFSNLAEHHMRVAWIALLLAKHEGVTNHEKILKMALVHDLPESRTGDVHYISRLYTTRDESAAIKDILKDTSLDEDMTALWHEYEKHDCIESQIVKDADTLDVDFELHEQASKGNTLESVWRDGRKNSVYPRLYTKSAKRIWELIADSKVHDWHTLGKNRINSGDWSKPLPPETNN